MDTDKPGEPTDHPHPTDGVHDVSLDLNSSVRDDEHSDPPQALQPSVEAQDQVSEPSQSSPPAQSQSQPQTASTETQTTEIQTQTATKPPPSSQQHQQQPQPQSKQQPPQTTEIQTQTEGTQTTDFPEQIQSSTADDDNIQHAGEESPTNSDCATFNIYVGNLSNTVEDEDLKAAFEPCGPIRSVRVFKDKATGAHMGYGFVHFTTKEGQQKALTPEFSHKEIKGTVAYCKLAAERTTLFVGSLPHEMKEEEIKDLIQSLVGKDLPIVNLELKRGPPPNFQSRGFCFVSFPDKKLAENARRILKKRPIKGRQANVSWADPLLSSREVDEETMSKVTTLYVNQITTSVTEEQLRECFSPYGEITKCHIVRNTNSGESRGFAFIDYATREQCDAALAGLNGFDLAGTKLSIVFATPPPSKKVTRSESDNPGPPKKKKKMEGKNGGWRGGDGDGGGNWDVGDNSNNNNNWNNGSNWNGGGGNWNGDMQGNWNGPGGGPPNNSNGPPSSGSGNWGNNNNNNWGPGGGNNWGPSEGGGNNNWGPGGQSEGGNWGPPEFSRDNWGGQSGGRGGGSSGGRGGRNKRTGRRGGGQQNDGGGWSRGGGHNGNNGNYDYRPNNGGSYSGSPGYNQGNQSRYGGPPNYGGGPPSQGYNPPPNYGGGPPPNYGGSNYQQVNRGGYGSHGGQRGHGNGGVRGDRGGHGPGGHGGYHNPNPPPSYPPPQVPYYQPPPNQGPPPVYQHSYPPQPPAGGASAQRYFPY